MKLSIIIPVYNVEDTLERCVQSVVRQTFDDFEVILVDDGSPDRCPQLCDEWAQRDNRISVIHKQNGGLSDARNAGLDVAKGDFVTFVDSDDYLAEDTYAHAMSLSEEADIVEFPFIKEDSEQRHTPFTLTEGIYHDMSSYWLKGHAYEHCYAWNKIYRRAIFKDVRFPKDIVFEDVATLPQLLDKAQCVMVSKKGRYYYCINEHGITATATGRELEMLLEAHLRVIPQWCDDRYYMHVLNIQLDVCRLTGAQPHMPRRHISILASGLSMSQRLKAIVLNYIGFKTICRINKSLRRS